MRPYSVSKLRVCNNGDKISSFSKVPIIATDSGIPAKTGSAQIQINVRRDLKAPVFDGTPYVVNITEQTNIGDVIFTLQGRDDDLMVRKKSKNILNINILVFSDTLVAASVGDFIFYM